MPYPLLSCDLAKVRHNAETLCALTKKHGIRVAAVSKVVCASEPIVQVLNQTDIAFFADSRLQNLAAIQTDKPKMLLRVAMPSEAAETVRIADVSLQSEAATVRALGQAAKAQGKSHRIVLMIDLGDLREGVFFRNTEQILALAQQVADEPALRLAGVGTNLTCFGGILPEEDNMDALCRIAAMLRARFSLPLPIVSGGNSSSLSLLSAGRMPEGITNLRLGESLLLGNDTACCSVFPGLYGDAFTFSAELVELQQKPSVPVGRSGQNAFGEKPSFPERGEMLRGIVACGRQDIDEKGLVPLDPHIEILGASSDHLVLNLTRRPGLRVGDPIAFRPSYSALLRAFTSPYVHKIYQ